jgi:hypothetical protein
VENDLPRVGGGGFPVEINRLHLTLSKKNPGQPLSAVSAFFMAFYLVSPPFLDSARIPPDVAGNPSGKKYIDNLRRKA